MKVDTNFYYENPACEICGGVGFIEQGIELDFCGNEASVYRDCPECLKDAQSILEIKTKENEWQTAANEMQLAGKALAEASIWRLFIPSFRKKLEKDFLEAAKKERTTWIELLKKKQAGNSQ